MTRHCSMSFAAALLLAVGANVAPAPPKGGLPADVDPVSRARLPELE